MSSSDQRWDLAVDFRPGHQAISAHITHGESIVDHVLAESRLGARGAPFVKSGHLVSGGAFITVGISQREENGDNGLFKLGIVQLMVRLVDAEVRLILRRCRTISKDAVVNSGVVQDRSVAVADFDVVVHGLIGDLDHVLISLITGFVVELDAVLDAPVLNAAVLMGAEGYAEFPLLPVLVVEDGPLVEEDGGAEVSVRWGDPRHSCRPAAVYLHGCEAGQVSQVEFICRAAGHGLTAERVDRWLLLAAAVVAFDVAGRGVRIRNARAVVLALGVRKGALKRHGRLLFLAEGIPIWHENRLRGLYRRHRRLHHAAHLLLFVYDR